MSFLLRPFYRLQRLLSGVRYSARRRFTRAGFALGVAFLVSGAMGLDTENSVAYQAFTLLLALLLVAGCFTPFFRARFTVTRFMPRFATAGQPFHYRVAVRNLTRRLQKDLTLLDAPTDSRPSFRDWYALRRDEHRQARPFRLIRRRRVSPFRRVTLQETALPPVAAQQEVEVTVQATPLRRGVLRFAGATIARPDPLGLVRAFIQLPAPQSLLVLPRRYPLPPIALPGAMKYQQGGVALASHVGQSEEFVALRDYRYGDPLRHIHWRSWARVGRPIVKEFEDEFFARHALVLDTFTERPHTDEFEEAVSVAASFACTVLTQESLLDLLFVGAQAYCFTAGRGLARADQMLEILASVRPSATPSFGALEHLVLGHVGRVSGCICVLLAWDEERRQLVDKLRALGVPVLVLVILPAGAGHSNEGGPMKDGAGWLHVLESGRIEEGLAKLKT